MLRSPDSVKPMRFREIENGDRRLWMSERKETSELAYYFVIEARPGSDFGPEDAWPTHYLELYVVSPTFFWKSYFNGVWSSYYEGTDHQIRTDVELVEMLFDYGACARIAVLGGPNFAKCFRRLAVEATACEGLFGFYLDRYVNRCNESGWVALEGRIGAWMSRAKEDREKEAKACAELIACFAIAGSMGPDSEFDAYAESDLDRLMHMASCYVNDWLIEHAYKPRRKKRTA